MSNFSDEKLEIKEELPTSDINVENCNYLDEGFDYSKIEK